MDARQLIGDFWPQTVMHLYTPDETACVIEGGDVIAHVGIFWRTIELGATEQDVVGLGFVCTRADRQGKGLARRCIEETHARARERDLPFALLTAGLPAFYARFGYRTAPNLPAEWFVAELGAERWSDDANPVDLRGTW